MTQPLRRRARAALADPVLRRALPIATRRADDKRIDAWEALGPGVAESLRAHVAHVKRHTLAHLDVYLERFEAAAHDTGMVLHWAATREEARAIIDQILAEHDVRRIVKAKSMTTEELELTQHLTRRGIETWETDLGEYIVQLSGKPPSHLTAPAIHEDTQSVSDLFAKHLGTPPSDSPEELAEVARVRLREAFLRADCGISGANFITADTGRLILVENEANIRLCTTLPPLHIAVVGIEKVIPREADLPAFLNLLARSATGQKLTTYTHSIGRPRNSSEAEGPNAIHVVLLDAGRTDMLADDVARGALACIRCGACLNTCPVYQQVGGHTYGGVYPGPIGAVTLPWLSPSTDSEMLPYASTLCGACEAACPVQVPIPEQLLHLRARRVRDAKGIAAWAERHIIQGWRRSVSDADRFARANRAGRFVLRASPGHRLPPPLSGWTQHRTFPIPAKQTFHQWWKRRQEQ